jgi:hypothetical protein
MAEVCPVVKIIKEYQGADEESSARVIKLGGSDGPEQVFDDISFYMMSRKMELARFELGRPSLAECEAKYHKMFHDSIGDYAELYPRMIDRAMTRGHIYTQFTRLVNLLGQLEELIVARVESVARAGGPVNVSLPDIFLMPHVDQLIIYRPDVLRATMNNIIGYVNRVDIGSIMRTPVRASIPLVEPFTGVLPAGKITPTRATTPEEYLTEMKKILDCESEIVDYISRVEEYQVRVINHVNMVYDHVRALVNGL